MEFYAAEIYNFNGRPHLGRMSTKGLAKYSLMGSNALCLTISSLTCNSTSADIPLGGCLKRLQLDFNLQTLQSDLQNTQRLQPQKAQISAAKFLQSGCQISTVHPPSSL
ncbi:unnamed protein product [Prunus brigantina]